MILINFKTESGEYSLVAQPIEEEGIELAVTKTDGEEIFKKTVAHLGNHLPLVVSKTGLLKSYQLTINKWEGTADEEKSNLEFIWKFLNNKLSPQ